MSNAKLFAIVLLCLVSFSLVASAKELAVTPAVVKNTTIVTQQRPPSLTLQNLIVSTISPLAGNVTFTGGVIFSQPVLFSPFAQIRATYAEITSIFADSIQTVFLTAATFDTDRATVHNLAGNGTAYVCADEAGYLFRSHVPCVSDGGPAPCGNSGLVCNDGQICCTESMIPDTPAASCINSSWTCDECGGCDPGASHCCTTGGYYPFAFCQPNGYACDACPGGCGEGLICCSPCGMPFCGDKVSCFEGDCLL